MIYCLATQSNLSLKKHDHLPLLSFPRKRESSIEERLNSRLRWNDKFRGFFLTSKRLLQNRFCNNLSKGFCYIINCSILFFLTSCLHLYSIPSLDLEVPKGPPAFRAGWYDGCRSALSTRRATSSFVYNPTFGNGIYQDNSDYQNGWGVAFNICAVSTGTYSKHSPWGHDLFTDTDFQ